MKDRDGFFADTGLEVKVSFPKFSFIKDGITYIFDKDLDVWVGDDHSMYPSILSIPDKYVSPWFLQQGMRL